MSAELPVLNRDTVLSLLRSPPGCLLVGEDSEHSWSNLSFPPFEKPLLRIWDCYSGSQPDDEDRMESRAPRLRLDTRIARVESLATHINHKLWKPTPYISFTTSSTALQELADWRAYRRGSQTLTVIDPNTRIADRLPILDVSAEMDHYKVEDPYGKSNRYYKDHYLCLWEVTGREVIGHWEWVDLVANEHWYDEIILPAFRERTVSRALEGETSGLLAAMNQLSFHDASDPKHTFYGDSDTSSEGVNCYFDNESENDTDDDLEEANAADDLINFIESNW